MGNQIFFSTGNQPALNLFESLKLAVYVKDCLCAWESYVSLSNAKYPRIIISIHQNLQLWQKSYCCPYTAIFVPKRWNIFMTNTQSVGKYPKPFLWRKWSGSWEKLQTASNPMASPGVDPQQETTHLLGWCALHDSLHLIVLFLSAFDRNLGFLKIPFLPSQFLVHPPMLWELVFGKNSWFGSSFVLSNPFYKLFAVFSNKILHLGAWKKPKAVLIPYIVWGISGTSNNSKEAFPFLALGTLLIVELWKVFKPLCQTPCKL